MSPTYPPSLPAADGPRPPVAWHHDGLRTTAEAGPLIERVLGAMTAHGYPPNDRFGMRLALEEALVNAVTHGHGGDPAKRVRVRYRVDAGQTQAEVEDQGPGFDPSQVPDPRAPENLERPGGRGLLLMRSYMTWCRHNAKGNRVTLCKHHSER